MSLDIKLQTNIILNDYLLATGRNGHESMISPQEYLLFRQQAIEEVRQGLCQGNISGKCTNTDSTKETANTACVSVNFTHQTAPELSEQMDTPVSASTGTGKITPITQKKSPTASIEQMLAQMRLVEG